MKLIETHSAHSDFISTAFRLFPTCILTHSNIILTHSNIHGLQYMGMEFILLNEF